MGKWRDCGDRACEFLGFSGKVSVILDRSYTWISSAEFLEENRKESLAEA